MYGANGGAAEGDESILWEVIKQCTGKMNGMVNN